MTRNEMLNYISLDADRKVSNFLSNCRRKYRKTVLPSQYLLAIAYAVTDKVVKKAANKKEAQKIMDIAIKGSMRRLNKRRKI